MSEGVRAPAASYAARLSALGGEGRRSSFGSAAFSMKDMDGEGGRIEKALSFSGPSDVPLVYPFQVAVYPDDEHYHLQPEELVDSMVKLSTNRRATHTELKLSVL